MARRKFVAGNWKMHGTSEDLGEIETIAASAGNFTMVDTALCLPATLIERAARSFGGYAIGAQDVHSAMGGAHTGCVSAAMLLDCGASLTIVGHSERRAAQCERDADVAAKAQAALDAGLNVILCVGESDTDRFMGRAIETVDAQLAASLPGSFTAPETLSIAYEPIWAIGTGKVPTTDEIAEMHSVLRRRLLDAYGAEGSAIRILYGGSVKASNASEIFAVEDVDGALVGGASLTAADFVPIVAAAARAS